MADTPLSSKASATPGATAKVVFIDGSNNVRLSTKADLQAHVVGGVPTAAGTAVLTAADAAAQRTALGLGTAATTAATDYATAAQGVTNGNSHDHSGGDGAQIAYSSLSGLPTLPTGTNTGDQTVANTSDATSHTVTLSGSGGSVQFVEGANITLTTTGTSGAGVVTIASTASGSGTVTSASVVSANGFAGTVADATTTPAITLTTSITGLLKGNGTAISAATAATDYAAAGAVGSTGITMSTARLLGRSTASTGAVEEITLGTNLSFSGTTLNATGGSGGGDVTAVGPPSSGQVAEWTSATSIQGVAVTGTGNYVRATSPTLTTPALGTPSALTLTNATGLPVAGGGTGVATLTAYAPIFGGTTGTGAVQSGGVGTAGQVLTSNGAGALPTFQAASGGGSGTKTLAFFTPMTSQPPATAFATLDTRNSIAVLDFDDASVESTTFVGVIPEGAVLTSGITARIHWMATTATSGNCRWRVEFERAGTDNDADSYDTATEAHSAASGTSGIETVTAITATTIDSLVAGDRFRVRVSRVGNDATNDTMTGDAELIAVELRQVA